jgi:hypothetical protein
MDYTRGEWVNGDPTQMRGKRIAQEAVVKV